MSLSFLGTWEKNLSKLAVETFFVFLRISHCRCIHTYDRSIHIPLQQQSHCHYPITYRWRILLQKMYHRIFDSETYSRFSPFFLSFATPEECVSTVNQTVLACQPSFTECSYIHSISTELLCDKGSLPFRPAWCSFIHKCSYIPLCNKHFFLAYKGIIYIN